MNEFQNMGKQNAAIRGYIMRALVRGHNCSLLVRRIANDLLHDGLIADLSEVSSPIKYLSDMEYVEFTKAKVTPYTALEADAVLRLSRKGIAFIERGGDDESGIDL